MVKDTIRITASDVKELRRRTGMGMMDAKRALTECDNDLDMSELWAKWKSTSWRMDIKDVNTFKETMYDEGYIPRPNPAVILTDDDLTFTNDQMVSKT